MGISPFDLVKFACDAMFFTGRTYLSIIYYSSFPEMMMMTMMWINLNTENILIWHDIVMVEWCQYTTSLRWVDFMTLWLTIGMVIWNGRGNILQFPSKDGCWEISYKYVLIIMRTHNFLQYLENSTIKIDNPNQRKN